jgi:RNA polymerase sigma-70 factor (TIGR02960 family)
VAAPLTGSDEAVALKAARGGDEAAFARLIAPYRVGLHALCYRMLGSVHDADDALQDALLGAWRGLGTFEGRSSFRSWLYRIATNAAIRVGKSRQRRVLAAGRAPWDGSLRDLGEPLTEAVFVEPYPDGELRASGEQFDPETRYDQLESVELAFVAALQELPATQRAVLVLRDVLAIPATEVALALDTSVASVNSSLQRARIRMERRRAPGSQQATLRALGEEGQRELVRALVEAWERHDIDGLVGLLAEDARFTMPPLPAWFDGKAAVRGFFEERIFEHTWRVLPMTANGQLALACYAADRLGDDLLLSAVNVVTLRGRQVVALDGFLAPGAHRPFGLAGTLAG